MQELLYRKWMKIALSWLLIIAILGILMRYMMVGSIGSLNYKNLLHAHSHVALLGWIYTALFVGVVYSFIKEKIATYKNVFYATQISIIGMFLSFPIQGYGFYSISFSTLFLIVSYWFVWKVLKDIRGIQNHYLSIKFLKAGLFYLVLSSLGPWALGPVMALGYAHEPLYYDTIYFFLHFLYNGFIVMTIFAFIFRTIERQGSTNGVNNIWTFRFLNWSIIPGYFLSIYWHKVHLSIYIIGGISVILLLISLLLIIKSLKSYINLFKDRNGTLILNVLRLSIVAYVLKILLQLVSAFPKLSTAIFANAKFLIIGYLHLVLLGFASLFLITWFVSLKLFKINSFWSKSGILMFVLGILLSEILLFYQGSFIWFSLQIIPNFFLLLLSVSSLMLVGISFFYIGQWGREKNIKDDDKLL